MDDILVLIMALCVTAAVSILTYVLRPWRKETPTIEFKCLEHMVPLDNWNAKERIWACSGNDACDAYIEPEYRIMYEGVYPPK